MEFCQCETKGCNIYKLGLIVPKKAISRRLQLEGKLERYQHIKDIVKTPTKCHYFSSICVYETVTIDV